MDSNWMLIQDVVFFQEGPGVRKSQFTNKGIKLLNVGNINNNKITLSTTEKYISEEEAYGKYNHFLVDDGDLLIACSGIVVSNFPKKIAFIKEEHLPLCLNTSTMRFKSLDNNVLEIKYFYYFLMTQIFNKQLGRLITGSAQLNFGPTHIKKIKMPLVDISKQKAIAQKLDLAQKLITLRKESIVKLDVLAKSVFVEMFGDPVENPMGWEVDYFENLVHDDCSLSYGIVQPGEEYLGGVCIVRPVDLDNTTVRLENLKHVDPLISDKYKKTLLFGDEILLSVRGTTGILGYVGENLKNANVTRGIVPIRFDKKYNKFFAFGLLLSEQIQRVIQEKTYGATLKQINLKEVRKLKLINPPITLQNKFAKTIQQIETQKALYEKELVKLQESFDGLLAEHFDRLSDRHFDAAQ